ncbi:U3 small nucleolar RNA-associated protein NOL7 [Hyperolius riggenbachi]|uniref:U3 small nucleolar RNA-associated protein NOL7 n=1 Tax=Hyperolius riggenbachi TaxID=752182 RepID=UPI0035A35784
MDMDSSSASCTQLSCGETCVVQPAPSMTPEHDMEDSEEEEAPEEVTFQHAKSRAAESARMRREAASREKALVKEKRKRKQELFSEQKKRKLLSDDILQTVSALPDKLEKSSEDSDDAKNKDLVEKELRDKDKHGKKLLPKKSLKDNYDVIHLRDQSSVDQQQQKAKQFLQKMMYGKSSNRTTPNEYLSVANKKGAKKSPAAHFTDNTWGQEEKKKAAKFNLQWTHRKKL